MAPGAFQAGDDDQYHGPGLGLGSGNDNGIGLMLVVGGNDTFMADAQNTLGAAQNPDGVGNVRAFVQTLGVFVKVSGTSTYTVGGIDAGSYPGSSWSYAPENAVDGGGDAERSIGMDRPTGTASWP